MSTVAEVKLWGRTIGAVALEEGQEVAAFEYDPAFAASRIEVAPLTMPLSDRVYSFPEGFLNYARHIKFNGPGKSENRPQI